MLHLIRLESTAQNKEEIIELIKKHSKEFRLTVQAVDPDLILSEKQVLFAVMHASNAFRNKKNRAKTLENEILLTLATTRSFDQAVQNFGIKSPKNILLIILGNNIKQFLKKIGKKYKMASFKPDKEKLIKAYRINKSSLNNFSPEQIILEKIAIAVNEK